jgi:hypothetical protein
MRSLKKRRKRTFLKDLLACLSLNPRKWKRKKIKNNLKWNRQYIHLKMQKMNSPTIVG